MIQDVMISPVARNDNVEQKGGINFMPEFRQLAPNLHAAVFSVIKLLPAKAIIEAAVEAGEVDENTEVIESTSGTFGLALGMLKQHYGYKLTLVSDPVIDDYLRNKLIELGAKLEIITDKVDGTYQVARLKRVKELMEQSSKPYFTNQYHNPLNRKGYESLAWWLAARFGRIDCLVGAVGTGGSMCGTAAKLREYFPNLKVIGVDTPGSVLFGQPNGARLLRGLGNSIIPDNLDHTLFDEVHWVTAAEAYNATRTIHKRHGIFAGGTSGAAFMVSEWYARKHPAMNVVTIFPDDGYRYQDTIYNDEWLEKIPGWNGCQKLSPRLLAHPSDTCDGWSYFNWGRRKLARDQI